MALVAQYLFADTVGSLVAIEEVSGLNGTVAGDATYTGCSLEFFGTTDSEFESSSDSSLGPTAEGSLSAWVRLLLPYGTSIRDDSGSPSGDNGWLLIGRAAGGVLENEIQYRVGGTVVRTGISLDVFDGFLRHVTLTWDASGSALYINGSLAYSGPVPGASAIVLPWRIGKNGELAEWFPGRVADFRIYDNALSAADVAALHAAGSPCEDERDPISGVFIDWTGDGFLPGSADEISGFPQDVMSWTITRGAAAELTGGSQPGSATLLLRNRDDKYNPRNASSPLDGLLRDGVPVWIGVNSDGALAGDDPRGLFAGRITDITLIPSPGTDDPATVEIQCEDPLGSYRRLTVQLDYAEGRSHDQLREAALVAAGETRYDLAHEIHTMPLSHADGDLLSVLDEINAVTGTRHFAKPADDYGDWYAYTTRNRQYKLAGAADESLDAGSQHVTSTDGWRLSADTVTNQQKATVTPVAFTPGSFTVWQADQLPITVTEDHPYTRIVDFDDVVQGSALDLASTGDTVTATYTAFATGGKIELTVGSGDEASITALSVEGRLARRLPQESYVADDETSQALPRGVRAGGEIGNEYLGVLASATGIATHVVWRYGNPQLRPTLTVENWFPEQFELDLYDVIAFTSTHLGMDAVLFEIVGLTHQANVAADTVKHHTVTYVLQESRVQADPGWFVLDTSELDSTSVLAY